MMMDKKSFMRGFGAGVLFAAVILGTSCLLRTSDAAVIRKAKQLGMTYAVKEEPLFRTSAPVSGGAASVPDRSLSVTTVPQKKKAAKIQTTPKPDKVLQKKQTDEEAFRKEKDAMKKDFEESSKELTIEAGDWSAQVSRKLEDMDIISDADAFDRYMEKYGYSDKIKAGNYSISQGADFGTIAKEITSK